MPTKSEMQARLTAYRAEVARLKSVNIELTQERDRLIETASNRAAPALSATDNESGLRAEIDMLQRELAAK